jgi:NADPH-dependent curcumin reductase CurA
MDIAKLAGAKKIAIATSTAKPTFQVDTSVLDKKIIKQEPGSAREGK